ncbi:hypothetical protein ABPG72_013651 [Tetrahymena utriculariae]
MINMVERELNPTNINYPKARIKMQNELVDFYSHKVVKNLEIVGYRKKQYELLKIFIPNNKRIGYSYEEEIKQQFNKQELNSKKCLFQKLKDLQVENQELLEQRKKNKRKSTAIIIQKGAILQLEKIQKKDSYNFHQQKLKEAQIKNISDYQCEFMRNLHEVYLKICYLILEISQSPEQEQLDILEKNKMFFSFFQIQNLRSDLSSEQNESFKNLDFNQNLLKFQTFFSNFSIIEEIGEYVLENLVNHRKYLILQTQDIEKSLLQEELSKVQENNLEEKFLERTDNGAKLMATIDSVAFFAVALKWFNELSSPFNTNQADFANSQYQKELIFDKMFDLDEKELFKCLQYLNFESKKVKQVINKYQSQENQSNAQLNKVNSGHNTTLNSNKSTSKKIHPENFAQIQKQSFISSLFSCFKTRR